MGRFAELFVFNDLSSISFRAVTAKPSPRTAGGLPDQNKGRIGNGSLRPRRLEVSLVFLIKGNYGAVFLVCQEIVRPSRRGPGQGLRQAPFESDRRLVRGHLRPALFAAQAGDEAPDRGGEVARRSGGEIFASPEEGYEHGPGEPARMMLAHEAQLVAIAQIDEGGRTPRALAGRARRAPPDMVHDGIVGVADPARRLGANPPVEILPIEPVGLVHEPDSV